MAKWEGLPADLLLKIAGFCAYPTELLGVCKTWKEGLEGCTTSLKVLPSLPPNLTARFHSLATLDLKRCYTVTPAALESLGPLPCVSLSLAVESEDLTPAMTAALRGLGLKRLLLDGGWSDEQITDSQLWLLEGLPISVLRYCHMDISDFGLVALRGMPMTDLWLEGSLSDAGLTIALRGMPLTILDLSGYVAPKNLMCF